MLVVVFDELRNGSARHGRRSLKGLLNKRTEPQGLPKGLVAENFEHGLVALLLGKQAGVPITVCV
jgi:hypothetical protein